MKKSSRVGAWMEQLERDGRVEFRTSLVNWIPTLAWLLLCFLVFLGFTVVPGTGMPWWGRVLSAPFALLLGVATAMNVTDLLRGGRILLVERDGVTVRATAFPWSALLSVVQQGSALVLKVEKGALRGERPWFLHLSRGQTTRLGLPALKDAPAPELQLWLENEAERRFT